MQSLDNSSDMGLAGRMVETKQERQVLVSYLGGVTVRLSLESLSLSDSLLGHDLGAGGRGRMWRRGQEITLARPCLPSGCK